MIADKRNGPEYACTVRASRQIAGPFDSTLISKAIGGNVRLYNDQMDLFDFTTRLRDAQKLRREAILPTDNGGYNLELAINEVIRVPTFYDENVMTDRDAHQRRSSWQFGNYEPNMFDLAEKRYLLDQALDHELNALINTLKHNLKIIGYPI